MSLIQILKSLAMFFSSIYIQSFLNIAQGFNHGDVMYCHNISLQDLYSQYLLNIAQGFNLGDIMYCFQYSSPGFIFTILN